MAWSLDALNPSPNPFSVGSLGVSQECTVGAKGAKLHLSSVCPGLWRDGRVGRGDQG